jgi:hypothetical protein
MGVPCRSHRVMGCLLMMPGLMVLCGLGMMSSGMRGVLGGLSMVFRCLL